MRRSRACRAAHRRPRRGAPEIPAYLAARGIAVHPGLSFYVLKDATGAAVGFFDGLARARALCGRDMSVWFVSAETKLLEGAEQVCVRTESVRGHSGVVRGLRTQEVAPRVAVAVHEHRVF